MTQEQFQDALGMIDDDLIESVDKLRQERDFHSISEQPSSLQVFSSFRKKILRREVIKWGSLAASLCLLVGIGFLWSVGGNSTADLAGEADNLFSMMEDAEDIHMEAVQEAKPETTSPTKPETSSATLSSPPNLYILTKEGDSIRAMTGTYSWRWTDSNGQIHGVDADSPHPLQAQKYLPIIETTEPSLQLQFDISTHGEPYDRRIQCWSDEYWDMIDMEGQQLAITNDSISLLEGGYIYELTARWNHGTVHYAFYVFYTPNPS